MTPHCGLPYVFSVLQLWDLVTHFSDPVQYFSSIIQSPDYVATPVHIILYYTPLVNCVSFTTGVTYNLKDDYGVVYMLYTIITFYFTEFCLAYYWWNNKKRIIVV